MSTPIIMPKQGQSVETCIINEWFVKKGDVIKQGDLLFSYETDKAIFEVESTVEGTLLEIFYAAGDEVPVLVNVAVVGKDGDSVDEFRPSAQSAAETIKEKETDVAASQSEATMAKPANLSLTYNEEVIISPRAKKLAEKFKVNYHIIQGTGPGSRIIEKDIEQAISDGNVATSLASYLQENDGALSANTGSGLGGRISSNDLSNEKSTSSADFELKKVSNLRKIVAQKLHASIQNSAQLTHHISADATNLMQCRSRAKKEYEKSGGENITINDFVCYAVIKALQAKPEINCHFLGDTVRAFKKVHLGFAVQTDRGLMVPALRNADDMTIEQISKGLKTLAENCKKGNIDPAMLDSNNASFTVSNLGSYGIEMFTPIINLPQAGILGVNTILNRPVYKGDGTIALVPFIGLSLTYDHRILDGAPASEFLKEVKEQIENLKDF